MAPDLANRAPVFFKQSTNAHVDAAPVYAAKLFSHICLFLWDGIEKGRQSLGVWSSNWFALRSQLLGERRGSKETQA